MKVAAILTCHNRKEKTRQCLSSLFAVLPECDAYVTDDGSTDGTGDMLRREFPDVNIIDGDGNLFWSRGMYMAWQEAVKGKYDFYLWLNDDVVLRPFFFEELMWCYNRKGGNCIIAGLIDDTNGQIIYGGSDRHKHLLGENDEPQELTNMNGNVVLVPRAIVESIGIIDPRLHHDLGDVDYALSAKEHGFNAFVTRKAVATGSRNDFCRVRKWGVSFARRMKALHSPLGSPPSLNFYFRKKHYGLANALTYFFYLYAINLLPDWVVVAIWGDLYKDGSR